MRTPEEVERVLELAAQGLASIEIERQTGVPSGTVRLWRRGRIPDFDRHRQGGTGRTSYLCPICSGVPAVLPRDAYVYLLGLYLGDGCISEGRRSVYRLRISCTNCYPRLLAACGEAMAAVIPTRVGHVRYDGHTEVYSYSKHWPCLFPQSGPGPKHLRKIELSEWQQALVDVDPRPLLRGLIHSDGSRVLNRAAGTEYPPYPRYHFCSASDDLRAIFGQACDALGIEWRQNNARNLSVAKRASVAMLDEFIGPKS